MEGKLDPLAGADLVWWRVAMELGYPEELQDLVHGAVNGEDRREGWGIPPELTKGEIVEAAHPFVAHGADGVAHATSD
ncbi:hypothetical protein ACFWIQ_26615 [Kitasatospora sp. NPDC127059]|uniref:hypothetical protein n=1 Tax=unclassified Kitasatospora TaxID=2633591 RepID=UPI00366810E2